MAAAGAQGKLKMENCFSGRILSVQQEIRAAVIQFPTFTLYLGYRNTPLVSLPVTTPNYILPYLSDL